MAKEEERRHAKAFRDRRRESGWLKLSFWLPPSEAEELRRLQEVRGTQEAAVRVALSKLASERAAA